MKFIKGDQLSQDQQNLALSMFVHRYTMEHKPAWATQGYKPQFKDDQDWLSNTEFAVTKSGKLHKNVKFCNSRPSWPEGK